MDLDLSQIAIDDTVTPTPGGNEAISYKTDDSVHNVKEEVKDLDVVVVVQLAPEGPTTLVVPSAADGPIIANDPISNAPLS